MKCYICRTDAEIMYQGTSYCEDHAPFSSKTWEDKVAEEKKIQDVGKDVLLDGDKVAKIAHRYAGEVGTSDLEAEVPFEGELEDAKANNIFRNDIPPKVKRVVLQDADGNIIRTIEL